MEFCWFVAVGCFEFNFFFFFFFGADFMSFSSFVVKAIIFSVIGFSFSLFFGMQFLLDFWFLGILLFGFNYGFVLV